MHYRRARRAGTVDIVRPRGTVSERFWAKVMRSDDGTCWPWTGGINHDGYGTFKRTRRSELAHRVAYEIVIGPVPDGLTLDHTCHDPLRCAGGTTCPHRHCVNPAHLEPVTLAENTRRAAEPRSKARTVCKNGHPATPENAVQRRHPRGHECKVCSRERQAGRNAMSRS